MIIIMDATWSVRITEELNERLSSLISDSGLNSKDFINQLIQSYELKDAARLQLLSSIYVEELTPKHAE
jgi:predicted DNA-binding protein